MVLLNSGNDLLWEALRNHRFLQSDVIAKATRCFSQHSTLGSIFILREIIRASILRHKIKLLDPVFQL